MPLAYELTCLFDELLASIRLIPDNMRRNLAASDGLITAEKAMLPLAAHVGRSQAHDLVQESVARARRDGNGFASALAGHERRPAAIDADELAAALRLETHTGQSVPMARRAVELVRRAAARLG